MSKESAQREPFCREPESQEQGEGTRCRGARGGGDGALKYCQGTTPAVGTRGAGESSWIHLRASESLRQGWSWEQGCSGQ